MDAEYLADHANCIIFEDILNSRVIVSHQIPCRAITLTVFL